MAEIKFHLPQLGDKRRKHIDLQKYKVLLYYFCTDVRDSSSLYVNFPNFIQKAKDGELITHVPFIIKDPEQTHVWTKIFEYFNEEFNYPIPPSIGYFNQSLELIDDLRTDIGDGFVTCSVEYEHNAIVYVNDQGQLEALILATSDKKELYVIDDKGQMTITDQEYPKYIW